MELSFAGSEIDDRTGGRRRSDDVVDGERRRGQAEWCGLRRVATTVPTSRPRQTDHRCTTLFALWTAGPGLRMGYHVVAVHPVRQADPMRSIPYAGEALRVLGESPGLAFCELTVPPRFAGPPAHIHHDFDEAIYVLSGALTHDAGPDRSRNRRPRAPSSWLRGASGTRSPTPPTSRFRSSACGPRQARSPSWRRSAPPSPPPARPIRRSWRRSTAATTASWSRNPWTSNWPERARWSPAARGGSAWRWPAASSPRAPGSRSSPGTRNACARPPRELGPEVLAVPADTTDDAAVRAMVEQVVERLGGVDVLVNAAAQPAGGPVPRWPS